MAGPIKPSEVQKVKDSKLPEEVFQVFNDLIVENWDGNSATFYKDEANKRVAKALNISGQEVYNRNLLDVETVYRKAGWKVEYDSPSIGDNYEANFTFSKKRSR
jgi:hypothetical protein